MSPKSLHLESGYTYAQTGCCSHKVAEAEATFGPAAGTGPDQPGNEGGGLVGLVQTLPSLVPGFFRDLCQFLRLRLLRNSRLPGGQRGGGYGGRGVRRHHDIWQKHSNPSARLAVRFVKK